MKMPLALASNFCQVAWVVKDIAAAEKFFIETMGIKKFLRLENLSAKTLQAPIWENLLTGFSICISPMLAIYRLN